MVLWTLWSLAGGWGGLGGGPECNPQPRDRLFPSSPVPPDPAGDRRRHTWPGGWGPGAPRSTQHLCRGLQQRDLCRGGALYPALGSPAHHQALPMLDPVPGAPIPSLVP